jgi:hypothetical protein
MTKSEICILILINIKNDLILNMINNIFLVENINCCKIVFWQNSLNGNKFFKIDKYGENHFLCGDIIKKNLYKFSNAEYVLNEPSQNLYIDRHKAIDYCYKFSDNVIYVEDDIIMSKQFVNYFLYFIRHQLVGIEDEKNQFVAGESIFFDSKNKLVSEEFVNKMKNIIAINELHKYYINIDFTPSSCLLFNIKIWEQIKKNSQGSLGMDFLNNFCKDNNYKTASPVVALCQDIGMLHDMGYSVRIHGKEKVREIKNSYVMNVYNNYEYTLYNKNKGKLYNISVLLNDTNIDID